MKSGKTIYAWAFEGGLQKPFASNKFSLEWPPKSGKIHEYEENDRGEFFTIEEARLKLNEVQSALIDRLLEKLKEKHD